MHVWGCRGQPWLGRSGPRKARWAQLRSAGPLPAPIREAPVSTAAQVSTSLPASCCSHGAGPHRVGAHRGEAVLTSLLAQGGDLLAGGLRLEQRVVDVRGELRDGHGRPVGGRAVRAQPAAHRRGVRRRNPRRVRRRGWWSPTESPAKRLVEPHGAWWRARCTAPRRVRYQARRGPAGDSAGRQLGGRDHSVTITSGKCSLMRNILLHSVHADRKSA